MYHRTNLSRFIHILRKIFFEEETNRPEKDKMEQLGDVPAQTVRHGSSGTLRAPKRPDCTPPIRYFSVLYLFSSILHFLYFLTVT